MNYQFANPSFTGQLYIYQSGTENYLDHPRLIQTGTSGSSFTWLNPANGSSTIGVVVPPGYGPGWAGPQAMLFVAFVNESDNVYHGQANPPSLFTPVQPTGTWTTNFNNFVNDYNTWWQSFNAVIYPAYEGAAI